MERPPLSARFDLRIRGHNNYTTASGAQREYEHLGEIPSLERERLPLFE